MDIDDLGEAGKSMSEKMREARDKWYEQTTRWNNIGPDEVWAAAWAACREEAAGKVEEMRKNTPGDIDDATAWVCAETIRGL